MANQIVVSAGAKVRNLSGVLTATSGVVSFLPIDVSLGIPQLDVNGKILVSQLPNSVMEYKGTWDASTNTPTLANGTGNQGDVYLCNVAGTTNFGAGAIAFFVGDQVIYSGSIWQRASGATGTVTSVALTESGDSLNITGSPITTSGTINIGFNGTNLQYVNGAGNLTTFPILTGYVTAVSGTAPVVSSGGTTPAISMAAATGSVDGYLSATDFAIFNAKQSALTFSSPLVNTSGTISIPAATTSVNGYLASADFTTFNNKQNAITLTTTGSSGVSTLVGATLNIPDYGSALTGYVTLATTQTITGAKTFSGYTTFTSTVDITSGLTFSNSGFTLVLQPPTLSVNRTVTLPNATGTLALTSDISYPVSSVFGRTGAVVATNGDYTTAQVTESGNLYFTDSRARLALSGSTGISYNNTTGVITNSAPDQVVALTASTGISVTGTYPNFTITNTSPSSGGTVTSVAALTIGTSGTDLSSTVANGTTTPVITLNVPTASATNRGALSSADWTTFNNKQSALTNPVTGTGTTNYLPKFTGTSTIGNSIISEVSGAINIAGGLTANARSYVKGAAGYLLDIQETGSNNTRLQLYVDNSEVALISGYDTTAKPLTFYTSGSKKLTLDTSGNLGLGVTPSAWSTFKAFELPNIGFIASAGEYIQMIANGVYNGTNYTYKTSNVATMYAQAVGQHQWFNAPSGTAGNAFTFTQAMTLTAAGRLLINTPTESTYQLDVNGTGRFSGDLTLSSGGDRIFSINDTGGNLFQIQAASNILYYSARGTGGSLAFRTNGTNDVKLSIASTGVATLNATDATYIVYQYLGTNKAFIGVAGASTDIVSGAAAGDLAIRAQQKMLFSTGGDTPRLTIASTGVATFSSSVVIGGTVASNVGLTIYGSNAATIYQTPNTGTGAANGFYVGHTGDVSYVWNYNNYPTVFATNNTERMRITSGGNVGIGTTDPDFGSFGAGEKILGISNSSARARLSFQNTATGTTGVSGSLAFFNSTTQLASIDVIADGATNKGKYVINTNDGTSNAARLTILNTGASTFTSSVTATSFFESSDSRLKTLIQDNYQTKGIASITPKLYTKNGKVELGYYAQDFVGILDSAVSKGSDDMLSLSYREVHTAKIYALEQEIKELKAKLN